MGQWGPLSWQLLEALALSLEKGAAGFTHQPVRLPMAEGFPGGTNSLNLLPIHGISLGTLQSEGALCTDAEVQQHAG